MQLLKIIFLSLGGRYRVYCSSWIFHINYIMGIFGSTLWAWGFSGPSPVREVLVSDFTPGWLVFRDLSSCVLWNLSLYRMVLRDRLGGS